MEEFVKNKQKILVADDNEMNRSILADMLGEEFDIVEAADGVEAVEQLEKYDDEISLVLLDIVMPRLDGFGVLAKMNERKWIQDIPVIIISSENASAFVERGYELGATDYIQRPFDTLVVRRRSLNTIMLYAKQKGLKGLIEEQIYKREKEQSLMIDILSHIVEFRNGESGKHVVNIRTITDMMLKTLVSITDKYHLSNTDIDIITLASSLHDIGKISIDEKILNKPGRFTDEEFAIMKTHTSKGADMLSALPNVKTEPLLERAYEIARWHHERWNGRGYPDGLKGDDIPISAQIVALADVYDALTSERCYKKAFSHEQAVTMILNGECGEFNPVVLDVLRAVESTLKVKLGSVSEFTRRDDIGKFSQEVMSTKELSASRRTLDLLDRERQKYQFITSLSKEFLFEIYAEPMAIRFFDESVHHLGVKQYIENPLTDTALRNCMSTKALTELEQLIRNATHEKPNIDYETDIVMDGSTHRCKIKIMKQYSQEDDEYVYSGAVGKLEDITADFNRRAELERAATHDPLTGLLNKAHSRKLIEYYLNNHKKVNYAFAMIDLDNFKGINDTYGHQFGDKVLTSVANALKKCVPVGGLSARFGGDEFVAFWKDNGKLNTTAKAVFEGINSAFADGIGSASVGIASTMVAGRNYDDLFKAADVAAYSVKHKGKAQFAIYNDGMKNIKVPD
ncbi:MAG: diguanylate cyclase [Clostridia bacterium]|nr:diguanylate cyclase [Clostridia bacterium]